jgi:hypothetical protein
MNPYAASDDMAGSWVDWGWSGHRNKPSVVTITMALDNLLMMGLQQMAAARSGRGGRRTSSYRPAAILFLGLLCTSCLSEILLLWINEDQEEPFGVDALNAAVYTNRLGSTVLMGLYLYRSIAKLFRTIPLSDCVRYLWSETEAHEIINYLQNKVEPLIKSDPESGLVPRASFDNSREWTANGHMHSSKHK